MVKFVAAVMPVSIGGTIKRVLLPDDKAALARSGDGEIVTVEVKHSRNLRRLRYYWALMSIVWENVDDTAYPTVEDFSDGIKICAGCRSRVWIPPGVTLENGHVVGSTGEFGYRAGHINFGAMEEADFGKFLDRVVGLVVKWWLPTVTAKQLYDRVAEMTGLRPFWNESAKQ